MSSLVVVASAGCGNAEPSPSESGRTPPLTEQTAATSNGVVRLVTRHDEPDAAHAMMGVDARLAINDAGCFALDLDGASIVVPDIWSIDESGEGIVHRNGTRLAVGDRFTAAGGYASYNKRTVPSPFRKCPGDGPPYANGLSPYSGIIGISNIEPSTHSDRSHRSD